MHPPVDICIVTQLHLSSNPRVVKEADTFAAAGYSVAVIAPDYSAWGREADRKFEDRNWTIVERPQFGPLASPTNRAKELARRALGSFAVKRLGLSHPTCLHAAWGPSPPLLIQAAKRQPASLYIGHLHGLPAAALAAARHKAKYAYDAEDFHPGDLPETPKNATANRIVREIEARYLGRCAYMTAASPGIADAYAETYGIPRPEVILNLFPKSRGPLWPTPAGIASPGPSLYWFSQTIGAGRGIETAVEAIARTKCQPHLYLRGTPARGFAETLRSLAMRAGVGDRIHLLAPAPPDELERLGAIYDIGFSGETGFSPNNRIALGNKLFSYLTSGLAILASDIPAHRQIAPELGDAVNLFPIANPAELARAIDTLLLNPAALARARETAWRLGQTRFDWTLDAARLLDVARKIVQPSASARPSTLAIGAPS